MYCGPGYSFLVWVMVIICLYFVIFSTFSPRRLLDGSDSDTEPVHGQLNILKTHAKKT